MKRVMWGAVGLLVAVVTAFSPVVSHADGQSRLEELHERLNAANARIARIQERATTVAAQVASIDRQISAVNDAFEAAGRIADRTQGEIAILREEILRNQQLYDRVQGQAEEIAIALYKDGPTQDIEVFLGARNLQELMSLIEYSRAAVVNRNEMVVGLDHLRVLLDGQQADLEKKLAEALDARGVQAALAQHLRELRGAQAAKLAEVREQIRAERREADSLVAQSAAIEQQLSGMASSTSDGSAVSGQGFMWPIRGAITSGFGPRWGSFHEGLDIDGETGDPIHASKSGTVFSVTYDLGGYGYYVVIDHGGGFSTLYGHASAQYVREGEFVTRGQTISAVGSTGHSTGSHLHFEIRIDGAPQDPLRYLP